MIEGGVVHFVHERCGHTRNAEAALATQKKDEAALPEYAEPERRLSKGIAMRSNAAMQQESLRVSLNANGASEVNGVAYGRRSRVVRKWSSSEAF
jgi:hypothetical protein